MRNSFFIAIIIFFLIELIIYCKRLYKLLRLIETLDHSKRKIERMNKYKKNL